MGTLRTDTITDAAGTGAPSFPNGIDPSSLRAPTLQKFTSGSGTYTTPSPAPLYLRIKMVGGGGGGGGCATIASAQTDGGSGGSTTFGSLTCTGGTGGSNNLSGTPGAGGAGGTRTVGMGTAIVSLPGSQGGSGQPGFGENNKSYPGVGASSPFSGGGNVFLAAGVNGLPNTGSGGSGSVPSGTGYYAAGGGGSGGFIDCIVPSPAGSYSYAVGAGGASGAAGTSGYIGGQGAAGIIIVEQYFQ